MNLPKTGSMLRRLLIIVPVVLVLILTSLFLPAQQVTIKGIGTLSFETAVTLSVGSEVAYASPDEYLQNPSFTGGITGWTLSVTTYDSTVYQDSAGSIKTITDVARNDKKTGTCTQTIGTPINSSDIVKLSLYWRKGYTSSVEKQDLKAQIARPSAPKTWIDIWSDTQTGNIDWTAVTNLDVSAYFTQTGTYQFRYYMYVENPNDPAAQVWAYIDNTHLDVTPAISVDYTSKDFEVVAPNTSYWSKGNLIPPDWADGLNDGECYFTVTNNSSSSVNITIKATNFTGGEGWALTDGSPGSKQVRLKAGKSGDSLETDMVTLAVANTEYSFITGLAKDATKKWEIKLETGTFTDGVVKESTITLTATLD